MEDNGARGDKQAETESRHVAPDASRDLFAGEIAGAYVAKYGIPRNPEEAAHAASVTYNFADALMYERARREQAERVAAMGPTPQQQQQYAPQQFPAAPGTRPAPRDLGTSVSHFPGPERGR